MGVLDEQKAPSYQKGQIWDRDEPAASALKYLVARRLFPSSVNGNYPGSFFYRFTNIDREGLNFFDFFTEYIVGSYNTLPDDLAYRTYNNLPDFNPSNFKTYLNVYTYPDNYYVINFFRLKSIEKIARFLNKRYFIIFSVFFISNPSVGEFRSSYSWVDRILPLPENNYSKEFRSPESIDYDSFYPQNVKKKIGKRITNPCGLVIGGRYYLEALQVDTLDPYRNPKKLLCQPFSSPSHTYNQQNQFEL